VIHGIQLGLPRINNKLNSDINIRQTAIIIPFAQDEMVRTFMEGIHPDYNDVIEKLLQALLQNYGKTILRHLKNKLTDGEIKALGKLLLEDANKRTFDYFNSEIKAYRENNISSPIVTMVSSMPKEELAVMAETLVSLTSFKRRVTPEVETVKGPIDVAVISKGDGFVWIKRKHYFSPELNPHFISRYTMGGERNEKE
jgi:hypothetical protein